eukprot:265583_1
MRETLKAALDFFTGRCCSCSSIKFCRDNKSPHHCCPTCHRIIDCDDIVDGHRIPSVVFRQYSYHSTCFRCSHCLFPLSPQDTVASKQGRLSCADCMRYEAPAASRQGSEEYFVTTTADPSDHEKFKYRFDKAFQSPTETLNTSDGDESGSSSSSVDSKRSKLTNLAAIRSPSPVGYQVTPQRPASDTSPVECNMTTWKGRVQRSHSGHGSESTDSSVPRYCDHDEDSDPDSLGREDSL